MIDARILLFGIGIALAFAALGVWRGDRRRRRVRATVVAGLESGAAACWDSAPGTTDEAMTADVPFLPTASLATTAMQLAAALEAQVALLAGRSDGKVGTRCFDNFSLGYLAGFVDAALQRLGHGSAREVDYAVGVAVERVAHYDESGATAAWLARDLDALQVHGDAAFMHGVSLGAKEVATWLAGDLDVPTGWLQHALADEAGDTVDLPSPLIPVTDDAEPGAASDDTLELEPPHDDESGEARPGA